MRKLLTHPVFIYGNIFYIFILIGFLLYTDPNPVLFHKYTWNYFKGLLVILFFWFPYNCLLLVPFLIDSMHITFHKKQYHFGLPITLFTWLFLLVFIFITVELILRMYPKPKVEDFHPFLQAINTKQNESAWHVNSDGFRYDEITKEKPKDTYRVFITGGSTVFDEWQPYERTLVKQVEDLLRAHYPERKIQVINAGYLRYTSEHNLILYATKLSDYDPDSNQDFQPHSASSYSAVL